MKRSAILTATMIFIMAITSVMQVMGQTKSEIPKASEVLGKIVGDILSKKTPLEIYPSGYFDWLEKMGDEPMFMFSETLLALTVEEQASMAWIPPGNFTMGDSNDGYIDALPLHTVYVSGFYMGKYEVTKTLWNDVYDWAITHGYSFNNAGSGKDTAHPVQTVSWHDCVKWCNARSEKEERTPAYYTSATQTSVYRSGQVDVQNTWVKWNAGYRLPTEAEWEKASRGGVDGHRFSWSDADTISHDRANYYSDPSYAYDTSPTSGCHPTFNDGVSPYTSPVGYFSPNSYGLYDMTGNVWEWCWDLYGSYSSDSQIDPRGLTSGSYRIHRGGSWNYGTYYCRTANRVLIHTPYNGYNFVGFRCVLPSTGGPIQVIEAQPEQPTYGNCVAKESGKDSLVLVTHGWNPDLAWLESMTNNIQQYLTAHSLSSWQVVAYKWVDNASTGFLPSLAQKALENGKQEGKILGDCIAAQGWTHVHLISHSAGAALIQAVCERIKAISPSTTVHCTFLDPFVGFDYAGISRYGSSADWSDNYFSRDSVTRNESLGVRGPFTESLLDHAYNVDVTQLDPNKITTSGFQSSATGESEPCTKTFTSHGWPIDFYTNTIVGNVTSGYAGFGFPLSKEGGGWSSGVPSYTPGNDPAQILGTPDPTCTMFVHMEPPSYMNTLIDFTQSPTIQSDTGTIQKWLDSLKLSSGSPAWLATVVSSTNPVNVVSFDTQFSSTNGAQGLLSVLWDDQVIGSIDERIVNTNHYTFRFPNAMANSAHILGFRLDSFTNIQSVVTVTNIVLNQVGVSQPFSLSLTGGITNGALIYQLAGEAGFEYHVQASTNLVDWSDIAVLQNTNGAVRFYDQNSTSYPMKFYRGVAPY